MSLKNDSTNNALLRYYIDSKYELESSTTGDKEILYLDGDAYSASCVYVKENGSWEVYFCAATIWEA